MTQDKLLALGLTTIGAVAAWPEAALRGRLGDNLGAHLAALARGEDPRPVVGDRDPVSIGHQETFDDDVDDPEDLVGLLLQQADRVATRLRRAGLRATVVVLLIKYDDFRQVSRRTTLPDPTSDGSVIAHTALDLLRDVDIGPRSGQRVRLAGLATTGLEPRDAPRQLTLDERAHAKGERLGDVLDQVRAKFGAAAVQRAVHVGEDVDDDFD